MFVIEARNPASALPLGLTHLKQCGVWEDTRAGRALVAPTPVTTVYERPRERVLFSSLRDANPFFHLAEAMWMLAGRNDVAFLNNFVSDFGIRFGERDGTEHDAYGHRWRSAFGFDQLDAVVRQLSDNPGSRQAVVQMWDCGSMPSGWSHLGAAEDLRGNWLTRPCNTHAYLRVRVEDGAKAHADHATGGGPKPQYPRQTQVLDITVLCRSNDIVWGAYGANAVQFSILQEYLAARLDVGVGTYFQFSNNFHCYEDQWVKLTNQPPTKREPGVNLWDDRYTQLQMEPTPLVHDADSFDGEVKALLRHYETLPPVGVPPETLMLVQNFHNPFLSHTVWPMLMAHRNWKLKNHTEALRWGRMVWAADWQAAACEWIERRIK